MQRLKLKTAAMVFTAVLLALFPLTGCGAGSYKVPEYADDKVMDIGAWHAPSGFSDMRKQETFDEIAEAGFTVAFFNHTADFGSLTAALEIVPRLNCQMAVFPSPGKPAAKTSPPSSTGAVLKLKPSVKGFTPASKTRRARSFS